MLRYQLHMAVHLVSVRATTNLKLYGKLKIENFSVDQRIISEFASQLGFHFLLKYH